MSEVKRKLTKKQAKFRDYYIQTNGNATESAILAGYSEKTAGVMGYENLKKPYIREAIDEINERLASERIADMTEIKEFWTTVVRNEDFMYEAKDRNKASENLAKTYGAFIDKVEHTGNMTNRIDMSGLSESELIRLANLKK